MLPCKGARHQECKDPWPEVGGLTTHLSSCPFPLRGRSSRSPPGATALLGHCCFVGWERRLPPALPRCRSKAAYASGVACGPRRKGVGAEKRGVGWLGWVRPPGARARFAGAAASRSGFPGSRAAQGLLP